MAGVYAPYDTVVSTTAELEAAFNSLTAGESVFVRKPDSAYRPSQWLDIDVDGVDIEFEHQFAENGSAIVQVADAADVGGIRIGTNATAEINHVRVRNFGFDGNQANQDSAVKRLHGLIVENAADWEVERMFAFETSPWHEHSSGGSGITVRGTAYRGVIRDCWFKSIGDRAVQVGGDDVRVTGIRNYDGYDRTVACGYTPDVGGAIFGDDLRIENIYAQGTTTGSCIGMGNSTGVVINNVLNERAARGAVVKVGGSTEVYISNIVSLESGTGGNAGEALTFNSLTSTPGTVVVDGAYLTSADTAVGNTVNIDAGTDLTLRNVTVRNGGDGDAVAVKTSGVQIEDLDVETTRTGSTGLNVYAGGDDLQVDGLRASGVANDVNIDAGATGVQLYGVTQATAITGSPAIHNRIAHETAAAETPQATYRPGTFVRFTDSGDGSGNGTYLIGDDGTAIQVSTTN